jgi:hypothetical protein
MAAETGAAAYGVGKLLGGAAGAAGLGAALASVVVMCMTQPRNPREFAVALVSTLVSSLGGGAAVLIKFELLATLTRAQTDVELFVALMGLLGLVFACGLPGWAVVRATFRWMDKRKERDIAEIAAEVRQQIGGGNG